MKNKSVSINRCGILMLFKSWIYVFIIIIWIVKYTISKNFVIVKFWGLLYLFYLI